MSAQLKSAPRRVLVFGASGHVGGPLVEEIFSRGSEVSVRLATSSDAKVAGLEERFPGAEIVVANYGNLLSLMGAFDAVDAAFVITPDFQLNERQVATNIAAAAWNSGCEPHLVTVTGMAPDVRYTHELPTNMRDYPGPALKYQLWREILTSSGLPVSFLNCWAYFMDDLLSQWFAPVVMRQVFAAPYNRMATFVDTRDLGAAGATLLLAPHDRNHDGMVHTCTGTERFKMSEISVLLSAALGVEIGYEDDPDRWASEMRTVTDAHFGSGATDYLLEFFQYEQRRDPSFIVTDVLQRLIGRRPCGLADWISEHRDAYFVADSPLKHLAPDNCSV